MTWIARGSLFWKGTVTNVLKNEKLPVVGNRQVKPFLRRRKAMTMLTPGFELDVVKKRVQVFQSAAHGHIQVRTCRENCQSKGGLEDILDDGSSGERPPPSPLESIARFRIESRP